jgi:hypothetical protein
MAEDNANGEVIDRLNIIIRLLLERSADTDAPNIAQMIVRLDMMGLAPGEIASIIGKPSNYVTATLHTRKNRAKRKASK